MKTGHFILTPPTPHPDPEHPFSLTAKLTTLNLEGKQILHESDLDMLIAELQDLKRQFKEKSLKWEKEEMEILKNKNKQQPH